LSLKAHAVIKQWNAWLSAAATLRAAHIFYLIGLFYRPDITGNFPLLVWRQAQKPSIALGFNAPRMKAAAASLLKCLVAMRGQAGSSRIVHVRASLAKDAAALF
jgi:hypothetical protein